jgi:integrase
MVCRHEIDQLRVDRCCELQRLVFSAALGERAARFSATGMAESRRNIAGRNVHAQGTYRGPVRRRSFWRWGLARHTSRERSGIFGPSIELTAMDGHMLTDSESKNPLYNACKRAGLRPASWHVLRHSFASHLAMRGVAIKAIQELLGHASIVMTMRYAHLAPEVTRDAVLLLDRGSIGQQMGSNDRMKA